MNPRLVFSRYTWLLIGIILVSSLFLPGHFDIPYPQTLEPQFSPQVRREYVDAVSGNKPQLVLIGDSVLYLGIDQDTLSKQLGMDAYNIGIPGSGSAVWYLILKNVVLGPTYHPKYVVVLFRDTMLTVPSYRTTGKYFGIVDDFAARHEPLVTRLAYINQMNPLEKFAEQYFPLYSARWEIRAGLDTRLRYLAPAMLLNCSTKCTDDAMNSIFGKQRVDVTAMNQAVEDAGQDLYAPSVMNFDNQVEKSFLPAMIQLAQDNNIVLVFVRTKTLYFPANASESVDLRNYIVSLKTYFSEKGVYFLDYAHDERIKNEFFFDSLHMNANGKEIFTQLFANDLKPLLK